MSEKNIQANPNKIKCTKCGAMLNFVPDTTSLTCEYCGNVNPIEISQEKIEEIAYDEFIRTVDTAPKLELTVVECQSCGATTTLDEGVVAETCDFCATPLVLDQTQTAQIIEPKSLLPFKIAEKEGMDAYLKWLKKLWWAPNNLSKTARRNGKLSGIYIPYWTFDAQTGTSYSGQRGDDYQETERYTNSEGKEATRTVTKTRWTSVRGYVSRFFNDMLVVASKSLPETHVDQDVAWDVQDLVPYYKQFLIGFKAETYQTGLEAGYKEAQYKMEVIIDSDIRSDIGGDRQQVTSSNTSYSAIYFKHILLPIWLSAYRYNDKVYRFMVNGRTGEVQGERPYSWIKITLAILAVIAIFAAIYYYSEY